MIDARSAAATELWLPLFRQLTRSLSGWAVWKNADFVLAGDGDVDSVAPRHDWPEVERQFHRWAQERDLGPVIACSHIGGGIEFVAAPAHHVEFLELGVKAKRFFRGSTLYRAEDFLPLMAMDARGFRRLRLGAEGLFKLVLQGFSWTGEPNRAALREKRILELMSADLEGVYAAARLFGRVDRAVIAAAEAAMNGGWDRRALLAVEARQLARGVLAPGAVLRRARFRLTGRQRCAISRVLFDDDRRMPEDRERWLREVSLNHVVSDMRPAAIS